MPAVFNDDLGNCFSQEDFCDERNFGSLSIKGQQSFACGILKAAFENHDRPDVFNVHFPTAVLALAFIDPIQDDVPMHSQR